MTYKTLASMCTPALGAAVFQAFLHGCGLDVLGAAVTGLLVGWVISRYS